MTAEERAMDGAPHKMAVEFQGGPADGLRGYVVIGADRLRVRRAGAEHAYEFEPATTAEGFWIYRDRGPVRKGGTP